MKRLTYLCLLWLLGCVSHSSPQTPPGAQPEPMASPGPSITPTLTYPLSTPTPAPLSEYPYLFKSQLSVVSGSEEKGYRDGPASQALFNGITDIVFDRQGNIFIAQEGDKAEDKAAYIRKLNTKGEVITYAGMGEKGDKEGIALESQFFYPKGLAFDQEGNLWVADSFNYKVRKITPSGLVSTFAGTGIPGNENLKEGSALNVALLDPQKLLFSGSNQLYVLESRAIRLIDISKMEVSNPLMIRTQPLFIDPNFDIKNPQRRSFGYPIGEPVGAVFSESQGYILDGANIRFNHNRKIILKYNLANHQLSLLAGGDSNSSGDGKGENAGFKYFTDIILSKQGYLLVSDNNCIRKVTLDGEVSSLTLCDDFDFIQSKYPQAIHLNFIVALAEDAEGNLIVAERNRLLKIQIKS